MVQQSTLFKGLPLLAVAALAVDYPTLPDDLTTPYQQRLAIMSPTAVSIGWNTYEKLNSSCVDYGTSSSDLSQQACSTKSTTYSTSRTYSNAVTLTGLTPATTYYYKIVSDNSTVQQFLSPRTPGDQTPFTFDVVIDLGVYGADGYTITSDASTSKREIPAVEPDLNITTIGRLADTYDDYELVIHPGDFAYADDWYLKLQNLLDGTDAYQAILEQFYDQLAPIAAGKPYMVGPGNHEADCDELSLLIDLCPEGQRNFTDFLHRFDATMPQAFPSTSTNTTAQTLAATARTLSNPPFWYSFEYGMVHFTMIDTETDFPDAPDGPDGSAGLDGGPFGQSGQQLAFLAADLASVDRTVTPWVIVAGHRPWYSTGGSDDLCAPCQAAFEDLLYQYGVDLGVFGHVHNAQRLQPVYNDTVDAQGLNDPAAPMYIVAGGAGNIEGLSSVGTEPDYTAFVYAEDYSYSTIRVLNATHLQVEFIRSETGEVLDSSVLYKSHTEQFVRQ
ncbi:purple acid phosphatase family protein [Aspergillus saccharolyticus JOP 1030-1]|uniref:Purple acid phosphatase n=1 Tax=Aspergillus saccharolyticus JOP 1030-1 TaxID=1450539 RepID=A0A318Z3U8_9EURO|nr:Metallo-dependent phosphatase [Aspergillus saccharolyticus JOP 1030-1]PYH41094.1 Metallo-dependent phosphatase [Aspergillus saccharolyticus JOP 1030-1]